MNPGAVRCHYCQAWQDPDANKKAQILDEGIIYWGKFLGGLAALLAVILLASGGLDLYHAKDAAVDAKNDAEKSKIDAKEAVSSAKNEYQSAKNAAAEMKNDVTSMSLDAKKSLDQEKNRIWFSIV